MKTTRIFSIIAGGSIMLAALAVRTAVLKADDAPAAAATSPAGELKVIQTFQIGGKGGWDYLTADGDSHRLFVPRGDRVQINATETGKVTNEVPGTGHMHGVAIVADLGRGYATDGGSDSVIAFDLKTFDVIAKIKTEKGPDSISYDPFSKHILAFNNKGHSVTIIDPATNTAIVSIPLGGAPESSASDGAGKVFVVTEDTSELVVIDVTAQKATNRYPIAPGEEPTGLAIDVKNHRLFAGCGNKLAVVIDADSGKVIANFPVGAGVDFAAFDPETGNAFIPAREGTLTVIHEDDANTFKVIQTVTTAPGARTVALDTKSHRLYLPTAKYGPPAAGERRPPMLPDSFQILVVGTDAGK